MYTTNVLIPDLKSTYQRNKQRVSGTEREMERKRKLQKNIAKNRRAPMLN